MVRILGLFSVLFGLTFFMVSFGGDKKDESDAMTKECPVGGIVAGKEESGFDVMFDLDLALPMFSDEFEGAIKELSLSYEILNDLSVMPIPALLHGDQCLKEKAKKAFLIYNGYNSQAKRTEHFLALVGNNDQVFYIENRFAYNE